MSIIPGGRMFRALALVFAATVLAKGAPITVTPTVSPNGTLFHYNYSITNPTGNDLAVLDVVVAPGSGTIENLTAPIGFKDSFDPVLGLVSFLEDTSMFGPTALSGFVFDSPLAPGPTTFNATLVDANFNVTTMSGPTSGPAVPEPGYLPVLLGASALWLIGKRVRLAGAKS